MNNILKPMLLAKSERPPTGNFIHQLKMDGHRCLLLKDTSGIRLFTRHGNECTAQYPEVQNIHLNAESVLLDGEMVVLRNGKPSFDALMARFHAGKTTTIQRYMETHPVHYVSFDLLQMNGQDYTSQPLETRLSALADVVLPNEAISVCQSFEDGEALFNATKQLGLEGTVSKRKGSIYRPNTRSVRDWYKAKHYLFETVTVRALRKAEFGWLVSKNDKPLGVVEFASPVARKAMYRVSKDIIIGEDRNWTYIQPVIQCTVKFQCYTDKGLMRSPSFVEFKTESA